MKLDITYTIGWIVWAVMFAVLEGSALLKKPGEPNGTLTWHIRNLLNLSSKSKWVGRAIAAVILAWLSWHFLYPVAPPQ